ncbi:MAG: hypothetical protein GF364_08595 [Candidatus Lokiarchaeota archaeon]|nr:hypothetical protein [Candidatus Lokiarchaeota archaeon]
MKDIAFLKVKKARTGDEKKPIIRIDDYLMKKMNLKRTDIIEIVGNETTTAIAEPSYPSDIGLKIIRMSNRIINNAKTSIDGFITLRKADWQPAITIVMKPINFDIGIFTTKFIDFVKKKLLNYPFLKNDILHITIGMDNVFAFKVDSSEPDSVCVIKNETEFQFIEK